MAQTTHEFLLRNISTIMRNISDIKDAINRANELNKLPVGCYTICTSRLEATEGYLEVMQAALTNEESK